MEIIKGVVTGKTRLTMSILLKNGVSLITKRQDKFKNGDKVFVTYNFEKNQTRHIWTEKEFNNLDEATPTIPEDGKIEEPNIDILEEFELTNT